jgi:hypothetical protein
MDARDPDIRLSEVISALSYALDLTEGQPMGHAVRSCAIGMRLAEALGLDADQRCALFYALLLKDAGCSSNAAKIAALFGMDDHAVKRERKTVNHHRSGEALRYLVRTVRPDGSRWQRARQILVVATATRAAAELYAARCERGAEIARMIELPEAAAQGIVSLDEYWDGSGYPLGLAGEEDLEGLREPEDPAQQRDLLAREAQGVA